jgi:hypothetical protein
MDKPLRVTWMAGQIIVHAPSHARAIDVALEYIRQPQTSRILVEPAINEEEMK